MGRGRVVEVLEPLERRVLLSLSAGVHFGSAPALASASGGDGDEGAIVAAGTAKIAEGLPVTSGRDASLVDGVVYSNLGAGSGYQAFVAASGVLGFDDYDSINEANISLSGFKFVGGVTVANKSLTFEFYDAAQHFVTSFDAALSTAGNFVWTITPPDGIVVPDAGFVQVIAPSGTSGQWFLSDAVPTVGTQSSSVGGANGGALNYKFELSNTVANAGEPNLAPASFAGWSDDIVISTTTGTNSDAGQILSGQDVLVDWGVGNIGGGAAASAFASTLSLDGVVIDTRNITSLGSGQGQPFEDIDLGTSLSAGVHTLTVAVDTTGAIAESSETDNIYSRQFFVANDYNGDIHGVKFNDLNGNGTRDAGEPGLGGWTIYLDLNDNAALDAGEPSDVTDASGAYDLSNLPAGLYDVREQPQAGWMQTSPGPGGRSNDNFKITVDFIDDSLTAAQQSVFAAAANRWAQIITGDLPDLFNVGFFIDDVRIAASAVAIDGVSGILGQSTPTLLRAGSFLPARGFMQFDTADLANMTSNGTLGDVILHEMGHVLGFGTIWSNLGLLSGAGGADPRFTGANATAQYNAIFGSNMSSVPVENTGGPGTRNSHWRESTFQTELMTGFLSGATRPISAVTIGQMQDLGYQVDYSAADAFVAPGPVAAPGMDAGNTSGYTIIADTDPQIVDISSTPAVAASLPPSTLPPNTWRAHVDAFESVQNIDFGAKPAVIGTSGNDTIVVRRNTDDAALLDVFVNNLTATPDCTVNAADMGGGIALEIEGGGGDDVIDIDFSSGSPAPAGGIHVDGGADSGAGDVLVLTGTAADDSAAFDAIQFNLNGTSVTYSEMEHFRFDGGSGADTLNVNGGTYAFATDAAANTANLTLNVAAGAAVDFQASQHLASLSVAGIATLAGGGDEVLVTSAFNAIGNGRLDLADNSMIWRSDPAHRLIARDAATAFIKSGFNLGGGTLWSGAGITSSLGGNGSTNTHTLGAILNDLVLAGGGSPGPLFTILAGQTVGANDILIRYSSFGDADLDGSITTNDYFQIDAGFLAHRIGFINGDFDYDGAVTSNDYFLIDNAFLAQNHPAAAPV